MLAREKKQEYQPSLLIKIFQKTEKELSKLDDEILQGIEKDNQVYENQKRIMKRIYKWESEKELASRIIGNNYEAIEEVLKLILSIKNNPYIGERIDFHLFEQKSPIFDLLVHPIDEIIPTFTLKALKNGDLSKKDMPLSTRYLLYKEYVCSATIRLGREIFAILPFRKITINTKCNQLNEKTGYIEEVIILSTFIPKETLEKINPQFIEPSIAIDNFTHNMNFKKTSGFKPVSQIDIST
jgi:hypothetical protein